MIVEVHESRDELTEVAAGADSSAAADDRIQRPRARGSKLAMPAEDLEQLRRHSRSPASSYRVVLRSRILLGLAAGQSERAVARRERVTRATVRRWRQRYLGAGLVGVFRDRAGRGRPPRASAALLVPRAQAMVAVLCARGERVSLRRIARALGVSYPALQRLNARTSGAVWPGRG